MRDHDTGMQLVQKLGKDDPFKGTPLGASITGKAQALPIVDSILAARPSQQKFAKLLEVFDDRLP